MNAVKSTFSLLAHSCKKKETKILPFQIVDVDSPGMLDNDMTMSLIASIFGLSILWSTRLAVKGIEVAPWLPRWHQAQW